MARLSNAKRSNFSLEKVVKSLFDRYNFKFKNLIAGFHSAASIFIVLKYPIFGPEMNFERFIASRLNASGKGAFTKVIIRIAIAAVALSLAVMIVTSSMIRGFKQEITDKMFGFWGHIHITDTRANRSYEPFPIDRDAAFIQSIDSLRQIEFLEVEQRGRFGDESVKQHVTNGGIRHLQVFAQLPGIIRVTDQMEGIVLKGVSDDFDWEYMQQYLIEGQALKIKRGEVTEGIIISQFTSKRLKLQIGDQFIVYFVRGTDQIERRFTIEGIYRTGLEDNDKKFAIVDLAKIQEVLDWSENQVAGIEIFVDDIDDADVISEYLYFEELPAELYSESIRRKFPNIFEWLDLQNINGVVILTLMVIVAVINMITALLILILERTNMIGVLKSLGSSNPSIRKIFLFQASIIIGKGILLGNVIGLLLCFLQKQFRFIKLNEADYYLSYAPIEFNIWVLLGLNIGTVILILLCLVGPTYLISRVDPVRTIQFR